MQSTGDRACAAHKGECKATPVVATYYNPAYRPALEEELSSTDVKHAALSFRAGQAAEQGHRSSFGSPERGSALHRRSADILRVASKDLDRSLSPDKARRGSLGSAGSAQVACPPPLTFLIISSGPPKRGVENFSLHEVLRVWPGNAFASNNSAWYHDTERLSLPILHDSSAEAVRETLQTCRDCPRLPSLLLPGALPCQWRGGCSSSAPL